MPFKVGFIVGAAAAGLCLVGHAFGYDANQVNAKAVSVQYRHGWENWGGMCCECYDSDPLGSITVHTIRGAAVTGCDTIYGRDLGFAHYPAFNLSGTQVAFYRSARAPEGEPNSSYPSQRDCKTVNDGKRYIAVINTDGSGLRNVCEIPNEPDGEMALDWPAGEHVYYVRPRPPADAWSGNTESMDVWRVNAATGQTEQVCDFSDGSGHVFKCRYLRRFTLDVDANRAAVQILEKYACTWDDGVSPLWAHGVYEFPRCTFGGAVIGAAGCNAAVSPGGTACGSFFAGSHDDLILGQGTPGALDLGGSGWGFNRERHLEAWAGENVGSGSELIRWSANSDKWVLQNVGWHGHAGDIPNGSNSVVCNWIDHVALNITKNPELSGDGVMKWNNCTGDMWIDDPDNNPFGNKYEDFDGVWHAVDGATPVRNPAYTRRAIGASIDRCVVVDGSIDIRFAHNTPASVSVVDGHGRTVLRAAGSGRIVLPARSLAQGVYVVSIDGENLTQSAAVTVR